MGVLNIVACGLMGVGVVIGYWQYAKLHGKEVALGRVVALPESESSEGGSTYGIEAVFSDRNSQEYRYRSSWTSTSPGYRVGDPIRIYFDRKNPKKCGICSFGARFGIAWYVFLAGAGLVICAWSMRYGNRIMEQVFPVTVRSGLESQSVER